MIYADNAATTKLDEDAFKAMKPYLTSEYGNASQPYIFARSAKKALAAARECIASCIGAEPEEIYFTSGGTESDNWAIKGSAFGDAERRATITSQIEHHAVLNSCKSIECLGYPVIYLPVTEKGIIEPKKLNHCITDKTRLVSIMLANNEIGTIEPIEELAKIAHEHGALFHTDAVQAVGHIPINVKKLGIDILSASAHKFNGPKGIGFLYIKKGTQITPFNNGGNQEFGMRAGTENVASIVGMATALTNNIEKMDFNRAHITFLENLLLNELNGFDYTKNGDTHHLPGNISLSFRNVYGETILHRMDLKKICISTGSACDNVNTQISHVIKAIKVPKQYAKGTIRISLGKDNTKEEIIEIANALKEIVFKGNQATK